MHRATGISMRGLRVAVLMTVASASAVHAEPPNASMELILKAWKQRSQLVRSARFKWDEKRTDYEKWSEGPLELRQPPEKRKQEKNERGPGQEFREFRKSITLITDGDKLRWSYRYDDSRAPEDGYEYSASFDGVEMRSFIGPNMTRPMPIYRIYDADHHVDLSRLDLEPFLYTYRLLDPRINRMEVERFVNTSKRAEIGGRPCVGIQEPHEPGKPLRRTFWLDVERGYLITRYTIENVSTRIMTRETDYSYSADPEAGWVLTGWRIQRNASDNGRPQFSVDAKVTEYEINPRIPDEEFRIVFPPGAPIDDLKEQRKRGKPKTG